MGSRVAWRTFSAYRWQISNSSVCSSCVFLSWMLISREDADDTTFGRYPSCDVVLDSVRIPKMISRLHGRLRRHCEVGKIPEWTIIDNNSLNGEQLLRLQPLASFLSGWPQNFFKDLRKKVRAPSFPNFVRREVPNSRHLWCHGTIHFNDTSFFNVCQGKNWRTSSGSRRTEDCPPN